MLSVPTAQTIDYVDTLGRMLCATPETHRRQALT